MMDRRRHIDEALRVLGVRNLVLGIHDPSFPSAPDEDTGRGSPYTEGGRRFLGFVRGLGFNGVQLGPQGQTSASNASPYDGTLFSKNVLSIALAPLARDPRWGGLLREERLASIVRSMPAEGCGARYRYAFAAQREALREAFEAFKRGKAGHIEGELAAFRSKNEGWLEKDALFEVLCQENGGVAFRDWGAPGIDRRLFCPAPGEEAEAAQRIRELRATHAEELALYAFCQLIAQEQHRDLRGLAADLGLRLFGDLQIGFSERDVWSYQSLFLRGYLMGAPPSRTNPEGQPWNYPVFDPGQYLAGEGGASPGPVLRFLRARMDKLFAEFDGIRIDHPHGLVCPWVYKAGAPDALRAVQGGARLFSSPDLPDHPELARFSLATAAQINRSAPRYADDWVTSLSPEQVERYAVLFDSVVASSRESGRATSDLVCEVLSTMPYPLRRVLEQHGLGRFRVTQKANVKDSRDVYRIENAAKEDWIMVGNHDTKPIWRLVEEWQRSGAARDHGEYLAARLVPDAARREAFAAEIAASPGKLAQAKLAALFVSRAENVMIFFSDLLGIKEPFNTPGLVSEENWCARVPDDFEGDYREKLRRGAALNVPKALAAAIRAHGSRLAGASGGLLESLDSLGAEVSA